MKPHTFITIFISMIIGAGCTSYQAAESAYTDIAQVNKAKSASEPERMIIYNAYLTLAVKHADTANTQIEQITEQLGGYVNEVGTYRTVIRVESQHLDKAIAAISTLGKVQNTSKQGQDVTEDYLDFQIRLDNALKARTRYLELLAKAESVEAALMVEKELERLNETIDLLKGKMNRIEHLTAYATISIQLKEKKKPGIIGYIGVGLYQGIKWLFVRN